MDEIQVETQAQSSSKIIAKSLKILAKNFTLLITITALTILPLSLLLFSLSLSTRPLATEISRKQALVAWLAPSAITRHVIREIRSDSLKLLSLKFIYFLPSYILSLSSTITVVRSAFIAHNGKTPTLESAITAVKKTWKRPLVTSLYVYFVKLLYDNAVNVCYAFPVKWVVVVLVTSCFRVLWFYGAAVLSMGMVVSVVEEREGMDALKTAFDLMGGRWFCGWLLGGLQVVLTGGIGYVFMERKGGFVDGVFLVLMFCFVVLVGYLINTVFYFECRKCLGREKVDGI
ncbi:hypothetical protein AMTRI_Chr12g274000 [Amborella trichopoda]|uniref:Uncharacterized protein n=1 Tax=Amborella trichopoda TaxID=13333 RepID=W1PHV2_AMBTC|nr:uncharacterized protein LOC18435398 [Amborella trichopoda]ERN07181.1 hypothetical protein AMTR_s00019p00157440 [Amborella trichopoda]|eukprot:XP_006845506.3 uncharacterized protein LOC18435398 [Amborella trichopoda]